LGEGNQDLVKVMLALKKVNFTGFFIDDHVPHMIDDSDWGHRGRAYCTAYIQALLSAVNALG
jgi:mannonate dehydratase